MALNQGVEWTE